MNNNPETLPDKYTILKEYFGHDSFRTGQEEIIDGLLSGKDVLGIMPTGGGKSMCYQIPAMLLPGVTIVISPLISLMHDQVMSLVQSGVKAAYINSSLTPAQCRTMLSRMRQGLYKIVYAAPERLETDGFREVCSMLDISLVAVDEAHCVSQWGQDFRPSYVKIREFVDSLPKRPVVGAFTATATAQVREDIVKLLSLNDPVSVATGFDRPNLFFSVITPRDPDVELLSMINERRSLNGIIYCNSRKNVEKVTEYLNENGFHAVRYHAGLSEAERKQSQEDFVYDRVNIIVATNAFGMGIDKSNVSFVIHYNMPKDIESYYQEAGRAGRDGSQAECILMYVPRDVRIAKFLIENSEQNDLLTPEQQKELRLRDEIRLKYMTFYCTTKDCLRSFILRYFGEKNNCSCGKCSNCLTNYEIADVTVDAQKVISCIARMRQAYGVKMICDVLRGSENARLKSLGFDRLPTYGLMKDQSENRLRSLINELINREYLWQTDGEYPVVRLTNRSSAVLRGEETITSRIPKETKKTPTAAKKEAPADPELFERLRALRKKLASSAGVPSYVVFTDAVLSEVCVRKPKSRREFSAISGVGQAKLERYGEIFMKEIRDYDEEKT